MTVHRDERGEPCTHHPSASDEGIYTLAALGSRMPAFHHDVASKLQSLMMALDELSELVDLSDPAVRQATDTAHVALRELHQLFTANRALSKPPQRTRAALADLVARAADRFRIKTRGELPAIDVVVAAPAMVHALSVVLDLAGGAAHLGRTVDVSATTDGERVVLTIAGAPNAGKTPANAGDMLGIAAFLVARDQGDLRCVGPERFVVTLEKAPPSAPLPKL